MKNIYFAGGCFWGTEHFFKLLKGVRKTETGYANGDTSQPTYEEVYTDKTGFAETVHVVYDEETVDLAFLVNMFFKTINPLSHNRQGNDFGTRYRTGVYYVDQNDVPVIQQVFDEQQKRYPEPLAVELLPLRNFYAAEEHHQDYLGKNPKGYCHIPIELFRLARMTNDE